MTSAFNIGAISASFSADLCWMEWVLPLSKEQWRDRCKEVFETMGVADAGDVSRMTEWLEERFEEIHHKA